MQESDGSKKEALLQRFRTAVEEGDVGALRGLLEGESMVRENINAPLFSFGGRAIRGAMGNMAVVDLLLQHGADINLRSEWWAGSWGALDTADAETAEQLITRGAVVDVWAAAHLNKVGRLRELLDGDVTLVNAKGGDGCRPLHFAWTAEVMDLLLERGAEIEARDVDHEGTAAQWAVPASDTGKLNIAAGPGVKSVARVKLLVERGAKVDLFMAAALGDVGLLKAALEEAGEGPTGLTVGGLGYALCPPAPGKHIYVYALGEGKTAYQVAAEFGNEACVRVLAEKSTPRQRFIAACAVGDEAGARAELAKEPEMVGRLTEKERAFLPTAAWTGNVGAVRLMLALGFDAGATGPQGGTALHCAAWRGRAEMAGVILEHVRGSGRLEELVNKVEPVHKATPLGWCEDGAKNCKGEGTDFAGVRALLLGAGARV